MTAWDDDKTLVTGEVATVALRQGEVLKARYAVGTHRRDGTFSLEYDAFDQQARTPVLLRIAHPSLLPNDAARQETAERLQRAVGAGGRYLPGLLDAGRDGRRILTVEPRPAGTSLREIMQQRFARGDVLQPREVLPIAARMAAAMAAIPAPWWHGDVRAEHVRIGRQHVQLLAPFLVAALPQDSVAAAVHSNRALYRRMAPEVAQGRGGRPADCYAFAAFVWEALTGAPPGDHALRARRPLYDALAALLAPEPQSRPTTLDPLLEALAAEAGLAVPHVDPAPFGHAPTPEHAGPTDPPPSPNAQPGAAAVGEPAGAASPAHAAPAPAPQPTASSSQQLLHDVGRDVQSSLDVNTGPDLGQSPNMDPGLARAAQSAARGRTEPATEPGNASIEVPIEAWVDDDAHTQPRLARGGQPLRAARAEKEAEVEVDIETDWDVDDSAPPAPQNRQPAREEKSRSESARSSVGSRHSKSTGKKAAPPAAAQGAPTPTYDARNEPTRVYPRARRRSSQVWIVVAAVVAAALLVAASVLFARWKTYGTPFGAGLFSYENGTAPAQSFVRPKATAGDTAPGGDGEPTARRRSAAKSHSSVRRPPVGRRPHRF